MSARLENQLLKKKWGQNSSSARKFNKPLLLFFLFCFTFFLNFNLIAQAQQTSIDCSFSLTPEQYKAKVQEVPAINAYAANANPPTNMEDIPVRFTIQERLRCYPNPFTHQVKVVLDVEEETEGILIVQDPFGKVLLQQHSSFHTGRNIITLDDFKDYPSGVFIVSVQTDEQIYSIKMLKNK